MRYGLMRWSSLLMLKCLGNLFKNLENPLQSSCLICQSPTKAIWWDILKTIYTYAACLCIELYQIVVTLERNFCHAFMIKIHVHTIYPLAMLLKEVSTVPSIHPIKCSTICIGLSLVFITKRERHRISLKKGEKEK